MSPALPFHLLSHSPHMVTLQPNVIYVVILDVLLLLIMPKNAPLLSTVV